MAKSKKDTQDVDEEVPELDYNPVFVLRAARKPTKREHVPTSSQREAVEECVGLGLTQPQIAKVMGISIATLTRHYKDELEMGKVAKIAALSRTMFSIGTDRTHKGVVPAAMYLLKTQGGEQFRETQRTELTGKDGKPLQVNTKSHTVDPSLLSHDQREALRDILTSAMKLATPAQPQIEDSSQTIDGEYDEIEEDDEA